jgi:nicotinamidase-related amidase
MLDPCTPQMQNEFTTEGGLLHAQVRDVMAANGMLDKSAQLCKAMREAGVLIMHAPITFAPDASDNPNKHLGILGMCASVRGVCDFSGQRSPWQKGGLVPRLATHNDAW